MWDNGGGRQGYRRIRMADDRGGGDAGQRGQRRQRYRNMDTAAEEAWYGRQKQYREMEIDILGMIDHGGRI